MSYAISTDTPRWLWWLPTIRGLAAVLFGLAVVGWPRLTLFALMVLFASYALVDGSIGIATAMARRGHERDWWDDAVLGMVAFATAAVVLTWSHINALSLLYVIGVWALAWGAFHAFDLLREEWMSGLAGLVAVLFGVLVVFEPRATALTVEWLVGWYALAAGVLLVLDGLRSRRSAEQPEHALP